MLMIYKTFVYCKVCRFYVTVVSILNTYFAFRPSPMWVTFPGSWQERAWRIRSHVIETTAQLVHQVRPLGLGMLLQDGQLQEEGGPARQQLPDVTHLPSSGRRLLQVVWRACLALALVVQGDPSLVDKLCRLWRPKAPAKHSSLAMKLKAIYNNSPFINSYQSRISNHNSKTMKTRCKKSIMPLNIAFLFRLRILKLVPQRDNWSPQDPTLTLRYIDWGELARSRPHARKGNLRERGTCAKGQ